MKILLDTNVLIDYTTKRNANYENAAEIVQSCIEEQNEGFITAHSISDFYYITRKNFTKEDRKEWCSFLINTFTILTESREIFINTLQAENFFYLEDLLQMECAKDADLDFIITENLKDFESSEVQGISISDFAEKYC